MIGWSMRDDDLEAELVVDALGMAATRRQPTPGAIHYLFFARGLFAALVVLLAITNTYPGCKPSPGFVLGPTVMATDSGRTLRPRLTRFSLGKRARTYEKDHLGFSVGQQEGQQRGQHGGGTPRLLRRMASDDDGAGMGPAICAFGKPATHGLLATVDGKVKLLRGREYQRRPGLARDHR